MIADFRSVKGNHKHAYDEVDKGPHGVHLLLRRVIPVTRRHPQMQLKKSNLQNQLQNNRGIHHEFASYQNFEN